MANKLIYPVHMYLCLHYVLRIVGNAWGGVRSNSCLWEDNNAAENKRMTPSAAKESWKSQKRCHWQMCDKCWQDVGISEKEEMSEGWTRRWISCWKEGTGVASWWLTRIRMGKENQAGFARGRRRGQEVTCKSTSWNGLGGAFMECTTTT